jgi:hypothetical protein
MRQLLLEERRDEVVQLLLEGGREVSAALGYESEAGIARPFQAA